MDTRDSRFPVPFGWSGTASLDLNTGNVASCLTNFNQSVVVSQRKEGLSISNDGRLMPLGEGSDVKAFINPFAPENLGDPLFKQTYGLRFALYAGSMANGISSEDLVIALGKTGFMGSFGAGGLLPARIEKAIDRIQSELQGKPFCFNLINSPLEPAMEEKAVELYLKRGIRVIEASAYLTLTSNIIRYRAAGLSRNPDGSISIGNKIIAKVSRKEVASKFLQPPSNDVLSQLIAEGKISEEQAELARQVPMADDITVEADSGGHTDNRPLITILPSIIRLRDSMQVKYGYPQLVRVGAAGGISTPEAVLAAFMMGAAYVATGSINQACVESGASEHTRSLLAQMEFADVAMAPASDMFEMGVKVQVLKRGTMFAMRAQKLYDLYQRYESIEDIPASEREKLETTVFKRSIDSVWDECVKFFSERDPKQIDRALQKPKDKIALIFRWYLGLSSRWSSIGEKGREMDYQIWTGPAMGSFNDWVKGTAFEDPANRRVAEISDQLMQGAAYLLRLRMLEAQGVRFPHEAQQYVPQMSMAEN